MQRWLWTAAIGLALAAMPARAGAQAKADIDGGKLLFQGMCAECHGAGGAGGDAPSLNRPKLLHAPTDVALVNILQNGIPNTAMPRVRRFSESETTQLVAYIRSLGSGPEGDGRLPYEDASFDLVVCNSVLHHLADPLQSLDEMARVAKPGAAYLAKAVGSPIFPIAYAATRVARLRSWDGLMIPLPFARLIIQFGDPLEVPAHASDEQVEDCRVELERRLNALTQVVESAVTA